MLENYFCEYFNIHRNLNKIKAVQKSYQMQKNAGVSKKDPV